MFTEMESSVEVIVATIKIVNKVTAGSQLFKNGPAFSAHPLLVGPIILNVTLLHRPKQVSSIRW